MGLKTSALALGLLTSIAAVALSAQTKPYEEEVVRSTYGVLSLLCSLGPVTGAINQKVTAQEISEATPTFEISNVHVGTIASIADQLWNTRFSFPELGDKVLVGHGKQMSFTGSNGMSAAWRVAWISWESDPSWSAQRIDMLKNLPLKVGEAVKMSSQNWTGHPSTYTRYATFQVLLAFQGTTIGPYTASFFFGKEDATGVEVVAPQDAFVSGQLLWEALLPPAYPGDLIRSPELHKQYPALDHWIDENQADATDCLAARSDLCCSSKGVCSLPAKAVARDLAVSTSKGQ